MISRVLPENNYQANINANSPSALNPYATILDVTNSISRFGVEDILAAENRIFSGDNTYGLTINSLTSLNLGVFNGIINSTRIYGDDATTEFYSPQQLTGLTLQDTQATLFSDAHFFNSSSGSLNFYLNPIGLNQNIQINYNTSGVGVVCHLYSDTRAITYMGGVVRFELGYNGDVFFNAKPTTEQNLFLDSNAGGGSYSRIIHTIASVEQLRTEVGNDYWTIYSPIGIGTMGYWQMSTGKLNVTGAINSSVGFQITGAATSGNFLRGNGTNFVSSAIQASDLQSLSPILLSTTTGINAKTVATTNLYTVPASKTAIITEVIIRVTAATAITVVPTLGIGVAAGEDDIILPTALTGLNATTKVYRFSVNGTFVSAAAASVIKLGIDVGATATTMTISVDTIGYLI